MWDILEKAKITYKIGKNMYTMDSKRPVTASFLFKCKKYDDRI